MMSRELLQEVIRQRSRVREDWPKTVAELAERHQVLPLVMDWNGFLALSEKGLVLNIQYEAPDIARVESDPHLRTSALALGARRYPGLEPLIPKRPIDAIVCPACGGSGFPVLPNEAGIRGVICLCSGLGWLPKPLDPPVSG
jgi:hypothetical protein